MEDRRHPKSSRGTSKVKQLDIPVSLGKPSLRRRLEAYYSLVSPDVLADNNNNDKDGSSSSWRRRFDLIYEKYGGSIEGEAQLARKLCQKYGSTVRLLLTTTTPSPKHHQQTKQQQRNEDWYETTPEQMNSGIVNVTSSKFDAVAALMSSNEDDNDLFWNVNAMNGISKQNCPLLDNIHAFSSKLPPCDPLYHPPSFKNTTSNNSTTSSKQQQQQQLQQQQLQPRQHWSDSLAMSFQRGPLSVLWSIHRTKQRIRVLIRYVDCIRGTLTGYVVAFDKHMNLILRDVHEVYNSRITQYNRSSGGDGNGERKSCCSNVELELQRRLLASSYNHDSDYDSHQEEASSSSRRMRHNSNKNTNQTKRKRGEYDQNSHATTSPSTTTTTKEHPFYLQQRHFKQLLVRGDNVIMLWRADEEVSAWPRNHSIISSKYSRPKKTTMASNPINDDMIRRMQSQSSGETISSSSTTTSTTSTTITQSCPLFGTPGSMIHALHNHHRHDQHDQQKQKYHQQK